MSHQNPGYPCTHPGCGAAFHRLDLLAHHHQRQYVFSHQIRSFRRIDDIDSLHSLVNKTVLCSDRPCTVSRTHHQLLLKMISIQSTRCMEPRPGIFTLFLCPNALIDNSASSNIESLEQLPTLQSSISVITENLSTTTPPQVAVDQLYSPSPHATNLSGLPDHLHSSYQHNNDARSMEGNADKILNSDFYAEPLSMASQTSDELLMTSQDTSTLAESCAPSDSGYGSANHPKLEGSIAQAWTHSKKAGKSAGPHPITSDRGSTIYPDAESIQESGLAHYVDEIAEELSGMFPTSLPSAELSRLGSTLPSLLKAFAFKLGFCDTSAISRSLMYLVHHDCQ